MTKICRILSLSLALASTRSNAVSVLTIFTLSSRTNIDFTRAGVDQKVASFLIPTPTRESFQTILSFAHNCNVQHFTNAVQEIPITKIRISVNGGTMEDLWTRSGSDCSSSITWSPPDPSPSPYADKYQVDVFMSWSAAPLKLAGNYFETMAINAYIP